MAHEFVVENGDRQSHFVFHEQGVTATGRWRKHVRWEDFRTLWTLPNSFLAFYSDTGYFVLPKGQMPPEAREYLEEKLRLVGVRVKTLV